MTHKFENEILSLLEEGKDLLGFHALRGEYEAEGSSDEDMGVLAELAKKSGLSLCIKIGGCEAIRDIEKAREFGADIILAPMIESAYAVRKYINSIGNIFTDEELTEKKFLINIETIMGFQNLSEIIDEVKKVNHIHSVVFGRVDFVQSLGLTRAEIESEEISSYCEQVARNCLKNDLGFSLGGGVSNHSIENLCKISQINLTNFETRKIIFDPKVLCTQKVQDAINMANKFELLWLKSKVLTSTCEESRITLLQSRV